jgi:L-threonylcarbamoyladenylate synthase
MSPNAWQTAVSSTDTVFGLVCKIGQKSNIERIYKIKERDPNKSLILFGASIEALKPYVKNWSPFIDKLAREYWPGALTLITERSEALPEYINPGMATIGLRVPDSPSIRKLLQDTEEGVLLSTSANISGTPPVIDYQSALRLFQDQVDLILEPEPGETATQIASTIIKITGDNDFEIIRQGEVRLSAVV